MEQKGDVCGAGSTEKVRSALWDFSDCSAEGRSGGSCQAQGIVEAKAPMEQFYCWRGRHSVSR